MNDTEFHLKMLLTDRVADDLTRLAACLHKSNSAPTQLHIQIEAKRSFGHHVDSVAEAARAIRFLSPFCGPLTHITAISHVQYSAYTDARPFSEAASVAAATLTHLSFRIDVQTQQSAGHIFKANTSPIDADCKVVSHQFSSFKNLGHLHLEICSICYPQAWATLPASLHTLQLNASYIAPPQGVILQNLLSLSLEQSRCHELNRLLAVCPQLSQLNLKKLFTPSSRQELEDLHEIMQYPIWCKNQDSKAHSVSVKQLHKQPRQGRWFQQYHPAANAVTISAPELVVGLPIMPTILHFSFDFDDSLQIHPGSTTVATVGRLLHHIPRAFSFLEVLYLKNIFLLDSDLTQLHACNCLRRVTIRSSAYVTGEASLRLVAALPTLVVCDVEESLLVTSQHKVEINMICQEHASFMTVQP